MGKNKTLDNNSFTFINELRLRSSLIKNTVGHVCSKYCAYNLFFMRRALQTGAFDQVQLSKGLSEKKYLTLYLLMIYLNLEYCFAVMSKSRNVYASRNCTCDHKCRMQQNLVFPLCYCSLA